MVSIHVTGVHVFSNASQARADAVGIPLTTAPPWSTYHAVAPSPAHLQAKHAAAAAAAKPGAAAHLCPHPPPPTPPELASSQALTSHIAQRGHHQLVNAALALQLVACFETRLAQRTLALAGRHTTLPKHVVDGPHRAAQLAAGTIPHAYAAGLAASSWPGRCQVEVDTEVCSLVWYLDGAHTPESMAVAAEWFAASTTAPNNGNTVGGASTPTAPPLRLLLFHCMEDRDAGSLLGPLVEGLRVGGAPVSHALFVPPDSAYASLAATVRRAGARCVGLSSAVG